ncbi:response regulator [Candidatus Uhrbacteria bacterium]|nr:response regulator [Candidatus Uhrbacteria bacterium]
MKKKALSKKAEQKKILIVEDERPMAQALFLKLSSAGFDPVIAPHGQEALSLLSKKTFDLILLDLIMPRIDGFGVLTELKKTEHKIPIIVLTNLGQEEDANRVMHLGARDYVIKSETPIIDVVLRIQRLLNR